MKLLKYVMTSDTGLAPNPYFGICSLALCTPNHMKARMDAGDWIIGHSSKSTGNKLIYAMCVTRILTMPEYFTRYPEKRPNPDGNAVNQRGDNLYYQESGKWRRLPSAFHNGVGAFERDQGKPVFLSEGEERFWYFGGVDDPATRGFSDAFPGLIKDRQGFSYVHDEEVIGSFIEWLGEYGRSGLIGTPRDAIEPRPDRFIVAINPEPRWITICNSPAGAANPVSAGSCRRRSSNTSFESTDIRGRNGCS